MKKILIGIGGGIAALCVLFVIFLGVFSKDDRFEAYADWPEPWYP